MNMLNRLHLIVLLLVLVVWTACSGTETAVLPAQDESVPATAVVEPTAVPTIVVQIASEPTAAVVAEVVAPPIEPTAAPTVKLAVEPVSESTVEPTTAVVEPITVTYITPAQAEGPYYPVSKPADYDNNLVVLAGAPGVPAGNVLDLRGTIYDATGMPLSGLLIEIWQTDDNGIYDHPGDPSTGGRDRNFQFYGEATTAADGSYSFRTILPGKYEPRPVHIHYKVKADGQELLTSQMYFAGDPSLDNDGIFSEAGEGVHMLVSLSDGQDEAGNPILLGVRDVVLGVELPAYYP